MGLRNWSSSDDPWIKHVRFNPKCTFVQALEKEKDIEKVKIFLYIYINLLLR